MKKILALLIICIRTIQLFAQNMQHLKVQRLNDSYIDVYIHNKHPEKKMPLPEQSKKLLTMLSYVIAKLDKLEDIMSEVTKLARRHAGYGVTDEHYTAVGSALLWTLEQGLGAEWNEELEMAWTDVYTVLAGAMMAGQQEVMRA